MNKAELVFEDKQIFRDGSIVEMRIWRVPPPVLASAHSFKYSLFYGSPGETIVLFDNERGKGAIGISGESRMLTASKAQSG